MVSTETCKQCLRMKSWKVKARENKLKTEMNEWKHKLRQVKTEKSVNPQ